MNKGRLFEVLFFISSIFFFFSFFLFGDGGGGVGGWGISASISMVFGQQSTQ